MMEDDGITKANIVVDDQANNISSLVEQVNSFVYNVLYLLLSLEETNYVFSIFVYTMIIGSYFNII